VQAISVHEVAEVQIHSFFNISSIRVEWSVLRSGCFISGIRANSTNWASVWIGSRSNLEAMEQI